MATVLCTSSHQVDLADGRALAPGETATDVDTDHPHTRSLVLDGHLLVTDGSTPRKRQAERLTTEAAKNGES